MEKELKHVGILGMKWGKRKAEGSGPSPDHLQARTLQKKKLAEMTNDEIKKVSNRIQLERTYKDLTTRKRTPQEEAARKLFQEKAMKIAAPFVSAALTVGMQVLVSYLRKRGVNGSAASGGVRIVQNYLPD